MNRPHISESFEDENQKRERAYRIFNILKEEYPDARVLLNYNNPFELLIATILAAQCTDERVNSVTPTLFNKYPDAYALADAKQEEVEEIIKPTGFYRNKAKSIIRVAKALVNKFSGQVPDNINDLTNLPGIGRKTANVVLSSCFNKTAIIVDTHLRRVTARLGLVSSDNPDKIEEELCSIIDEKDRTTFSHVIGFHGRYVCKARKPMCDTCKVKELCNYFMNNR